MRSVKGLNQVCELLVYARSRRVKQYTLVAAALESWLHFVLDVGDCAARMGTYHAVTIIQDV